MIKFHPALLVMAFSGAVMLTGCGDDNNNNNSGGQQPGTAAPAAPADVEGIYVGEGNVSITADDDPVGVSGNTEVAMELTQEGSSVTGEYIAVEQGGEAALLGEITGTVSGNNVDITITHEGEAECATWTSKGALTLQGDRLQGKVQGTCAGVVVDQAFRLDRQ